MVGGLLFGMILTRAVDGTLKNIFLSGENKYNHKSFPGKGFRSLGQEAIFAAGLALNPKEDYVAPLIRDLGLVLAFTDDIELCLNAQMGRAYKPSYGKDLHVGDFERHVLMPAAPLAISACTAVGMAMALKKQKSPGIVLTCIGEGGTSLGEWHEAINLASVWDLPMIFCVQNNQTALSTKTSEQCRVKSFADKAIGYGLEGISLDGTDADLIYTTFSNLKKQIQTTQRPVLVELSCMRMCGHAHHDDMQYWGKEQNHGFQYPVYEGGYADPILYEKWLKKDPIELYFKKLEKAGLCTQKEFDKHKETALKRCEEAKKAILALPWPTLETAPIEVFCKSQENPQMPFAFLPNPKGSTYLEAISKTLEDILKEYPESLVVGEDVAPPYGNAFGMFKKISKACWGQFYNTPISENAILGAGVGMSILGLKPILEMQFNDFVASGFNQLVNNAAKFFYRTGLPVPLVIRMPFGGLRSAGPYHSQDTSPWFYRCPGLKILCPSTPQDARDLLYTAFLDPNPVLFYEHIALYRDPGLREILSEKPRRLKIGEAALRQEGKDITLITYGAYVHILLQVAKELLEKNITCDVIDLRSLMPIDYDTITKSVQKTNRVLLAGEDSKTGSILQSIASEIGERCFEYLEAPIRVLGSLDTPVPYAPSLEEAFLLSKKQIVEECIDLMGF